MLSRFLTKKEQLVLTLLSGAILVGALAVYAIQVRNPQSGTVALAEPELPSEADAEEPEVPEAASASEFPAEDPAPPPLPAKAVVSVRGAVNDPGVYELREGDRINDLIERAGGTTPEADLADINLAARLIDGTTLLVPEKARAGRRPAGLNRNPQEYTIHGWQAGQARAVADRNAAQGSAPPGQSAGLLDLNRASQPELEGLPGIGPKLAEAIMAHRKTRRFRTIDDLQEVHGIGEKRFEVLRGLVTVW